MSPGIVAEDKNGTKTRSVAETELGERAEIEPTTTRDSPRPRLEPVDQRPFPQPSADHSPLTVDQRPVSTVEDPDVIHFDNSFDLSLSTSLNDLDNVTLHIDGQSTKVDAPPDIIDLDEDDDIIDDEDALPHDLADSDDEDLVNVDDDDDGVDVVYSSEEED
ncbi:hypothetical protein Tco_0648956 [Tanacetum coccineum]